GPARRRLTVVGEGPAGDLPDVLRSFERHLRLKNLTPRTIASYLQAARLMAEWLLERYGPISIAQLTDEHLREYFRYLHDGPKLPARRTKGGAVGDTGEEARRSAATVANRYRSLQQFFKYLVEE